jgi:hypothetical protein
MSGITLATAKEQLQLWLKASEAVAAGQSYRIGTQQLSRVDSDSILRQIQYWQKQVSQLSGGGRSRMHRVVIRDL